MRNCGTVPHCPGNSSNSSGVTQCDRCVTLWAEAAWQKKHGTNPNWVVLSFSFFSSPFQERRQSQMTHIFGKVSNHQLERKLVLEMTAQPNSNLGLSKNTSHMLQIRDSNLRLVLNSPISSYFHSRKRGNMSNFGTSLCFKSLKNQKTNTNGADARLH